jgi:DNA-binding NtrC family response regulator
VFTPLAPSTRPPFLLSPQHAPRVYVGKSPTCEFCLEDPAVSRRHAGLELRDDGVRLTDLASTNGTWVNGLRIHDVTLRGGEVIQFGPVAVRVDFGQSVAPPAASSAARFGKVTGTSDAMRRLYPLLDRLAASGVPVLIEGETGTGKEVVAESLHEAGPRANKPFVVFDCTTVPANLLESALFGHEKGSFTGATSTRLGVFEQANGGTLFIDEIGDLDIALQARLLRAIERQEVQRVGATSWSKVDVRVMSATRRDLEREIQAGRFRDDLFFRLAVARVELPPLRARTGDVELLARYFWRQFGGLDSDLTLDLLARLTAYEWPGNVRQLANAIAQRIALGDLAPSHVAGRERTTGAQSIPPPSATPSSASGSVEAVPPTSTRRDVVEDVIAEGLAFQVARERVMADFEHRYTDAILAKHAGNVSRAAAASGIARRYFYVLRSRTNPKG